MVSLTKDHDKDTRTGRRRSEPPSAAPTSRRGFLTLTGGALLSVAAGTAVAGDLYASRRGVFASGTGPAYAPWPDWEKGAAPLRLVRAAILAANAHNAQAWRFVVSRTRIAVYDDTTRGLGTVDPYRREMHLSAGCAIENLALAARAVGMAPAVALAPDGPSGLLATVDLRPGSNAAPGPGSDLYRAIPHRHTDRGPYQVDRSLPADIPRAMDALVEDPDVQLLWLLDSAQRKQFSTLTVEATQAFIDDRKQSEDDYAWYRGTAGQVRAHRDGVTVDASGLSPVLRSMGKLAPASRSSNDSYWLAGTRDRQLPTASGFAIVLVRDTADLAQRLAAGRLYQRLHLWATSRALAMQPLNQVVERAERERSTTGTGLIGSGLTALMADPTWQPVMPFRDRLPHRHCLAQSSPRSVRRGGDPAVTATMNPATTDYGSGRTNRWWSVVTAALAGGYLFLGATSPHPAIRWPTLAGGLLVLAALWLATRSRPAALTGLITGALLPVPTTWWSLVTPATALVILACGLLALRTTNPGTAVVKER
jgi:hypothetical protein